MPKTASEETERLKRVWEREAPGYDWRMGFFEKVLFGDGREWVCSQAHGEVLEVAVGTGRIFRRSGLHALLVQHTRRPQGCRGDEARTPPERKAPALRPHKGFF